MFRTKLNLLAIGIICCVLVVTFVSQNSMDSVSKNIKQYSQAKPTTVPEYYEMTIPSLRERAYTSKLGELEYVRDEDAYTVYKTSYKSDDLTIYGMLTIPKGEKPANGFPAVVFVHGYIPPKSYETFGRPYTKYVDYIANNGFVVFKIDLRGHDQSEGNATGAYYSSGYVIDTLHAYSALQRTDFINKNAVGVWGHSMAGNIVMRSLAVNPDIPVGVIWAGAGYSYTDLQKYRINDASYDPTQSTQRNSNSRTKMRELYGTPDAKSQFWKEIAPTTYLNDMKTALSLHHAVDDEVVNVGYSRDLVSLLDKTQLTHEYYEYPSGGHNISDENFIIAMERTVAFYKKYLR